ncbi:hypothetical protein Mgra_00004734 [Meloidogyne graminicola]|uniref:Calcyclin-binding protein n=1 Tax=Meloidogyne graminicola TaxID=189291 RepID=A0A8S9ZRG0_9BILA|nr:hypothetical protein Mgra_00004734 [Meloidogyne graminicola]
MPSASELKGDIDELEMLKKQSKRINVQMFLDDQLHKLLANLDELNRRELNAKDSSKIVGNTSRPYKKLTSYGFDESDKFVKLYYSLPGISDASAASIKTVFNENSFEIHCTDINGIDYEINVRGLLKGVDPSKCQFKQKSGDQLLVIMPKFDKEEDPQASLMNMMKQMYDEGDDEMKRTIRKSWYEAQNKKSSEMEF